jgi:hypothetical protein
VQLRFLVAAGIVVAVTGCAKPQPIYRWGIYETLIYESYTTADGSIPGTHSARLSEDIARTQAEGRRVPPGVHAHLGFLYYSQGEIDAARAQFISEKELFPESSTFMDGILARMENR